MEQKVCKNCGGQLFYEEGVYMCDFCGSVFEEMRNPQTGEQLDRAYELIRANEYERAEEICTEIIGKENKNHEAYWVRALARHGVLFVDDYGKKVPTVNSISERSFLNDGDVKNAIAFSSGRIGESYRKLGEKIENIRIEWLKKASQEPEYDVFLCYKDSDKDNGIDRTNDSLYMQELYTSLVEKGYRVFFSRVSLREKVSEMYEPYIYNALKTSKVMIVYAERKDYFYSPWMKNEWSRYINMINRGEKDRESLIVAYKNVDPYELPMTLISGRQGLDMSALASPSVLFGKVGQLVAESAKGVRLTTVEVQGGMISQKVSEIRNERIEKRVIGSMEQGVHLDISEQRKLELVDDYLLGGYSAEAENLLAEIERKNPKSAGAMFRRILLLCDCKSENELLQLTEFTETDQLARLLEYADAEFAMKVLDLFYAMNIEDDDCCEAVLQIILPYDYERRWDNIRKKFSYVIERGFHFSFELLLKTIPSDEVDLYIDLNLRFMDRMLEENDTEEAELYAKHVLELEEGNVRALSAMCHLCLMDESIDMGDLVQYFEKLLSYTDNQAGAVKELLWFVSRVKYCDQSNEVFKQILKYYIGNLLDIQEQIFAFAELLMEHEEYEKAQYYIGLLLTADRGNIRAWWDICLIEIRAKNGSDVLNSNLLLARCQHWNDYLAVMSREQRPGAIEYAAKQADKVKERQKMFRQEVKKRQNDNAARQTNIERCDQEVVVLKKKRRKMNLLRADSTMFWMTTFLWLFIVVDILAALNIYLIKHNTWLEIYTWYGMHYGYEYPELENILAELAYPFANKRFYEWSVVIVWIASIAAVILNIGMLTHIEYVSVFPAILLGSVLFPVGVIINSVYCFKEVRRRKNRLQEIIQIQEKKRSDLKHELLADNQKLIGMRNNAIEHFLFARETVDAIVHYDRLAKEVQ